MLGLALHQMQPIHVAILDVSLQFGSTLKRLFQRFPRQTVKVNNHTKRYLLVWKADVFSLYTERTTILKDFDDYNRTYSEVTSNFGDPQSTRMVSRGPSMGSRCPT